VIRFLTLNDLQVKEIEAELEHRYEDGAPEIRAVKHGDDVSSRERSILEMAQAREIRQIPALLA
jgi:hypothetical protein